MIRLLPQNPTPAPPSNGNQLFLSKFQEEASKRKKARVGWNQLDPR